MSDFLDAAVELLAEYGEPVTIKNRSGTTIGTAVQSYHDPVASYPDYFPESGANADAIGLGTIYFAGSVIVGEGYTICRANGTHQVLEVASPQDGTTVAIRIAKCRKV